MANKLKNKELNNLGGERTAEIVAGQLENDEQHDKRKRRRRSRQLNETPQQRLKDYQRQTNYTIIKSNLGRQLQPYHCKSLQYFRNVKKDFLTSEPH